MNMAAIEREASQQINSIQWIGFHWNPNEIHLNSSQNIMNQPPNNWENIQKCM